MIVRSRHVFASLVIAASVVGVASGASAVARSCRYLKAAEVRRVVGDSSVSKATSPSAPDSVTRCDYDIGTAQDSSVHLWVQRDDAEDGFGTAKKAFADDVEPVKGFGTRAFYVAGGFNVLYVLRGETLIYVQYSTPSDDDAVTKATVGQLMKIVLARI